MNKVQKSKIISAIGNAEVPKWVSVIVINGNDEIWGYRSKPYYISTEKKSKRLKVRPAQLGELYCVFLGEFSMGDSLEHIIKVEDLFK